MHAVTFPPVFVLLFSVAFTTSFPSNDAAIPSSDCPQTFDCGPLKNLSYPFSLLDNCGPPEFRLTCDEDSPELNSSPITYRVLRLDQIGKTMTLARSDLWNNTCLHEFANSTLKATSFTYGTDNEDLTLYYGCAPLTVKPSNQFNCTIDGNSSNAYFLTGLVPTDPVLSIVINCSVGLRLKILKTAAIELTANKSTLGQVLMEGFNVNYSGPYSEKCDKCVGSGERCVFDSHSNETICSGAGISQGVRIVLIAAFSAGVLVVVGTIVIIYYRTRGIFSWVWWTRDARNEYCSAEEIIKRYGSIAPKRYSYSDLKKLTNSFKDKIGKGGFGVVYKGKLHDGRIVAVKVLSSSKEQSIVSMMGMRGTPGYIAPEVFSRNFGGVSHKSDVYSYGMLVLEMVGGKREYTERTSNSSEVYFPDCVYSKLEQGENFRTNSEIGGEEEEILKKMTIVGLWCIQTHPLDRPSMSKVIEMLEGTSHSLRIPPRPCLDSPKRSPQDSSTSLWERVEPTEGD